MFWGKSKEEKQKEKILKQMKEKKVQIDKLKEEMNNMAKLVLKDGKLQKVEDTPKQEEPLGPLGNVPVPPPALDSRRPIPQQYQEDIFENPRRQPTPNEVQQIRQQIMEENRAKQEQQLRQEQLRLFQEQEQMRMMQEQAAQRQFVPPPMPPHQYYQQPVYQNPLPPPVQSVVVVIEMVNGSLYKYEITTDVLKQFIEELNSAINQQTTYSLNDRTINGKNIVSYFIE